MDSVDIAFGEWLPSQPTFKNPGCEVAKNVIPAPGGSYDPLNALSETAITATDTVKGATQLFDSSDASVIVGGTDDSLFIYGSTLTETGSLSSIGAGQAWDFTRFNDFVFATGANNAPQYLSDIDSDTSWSAAPGSPPNATKCAKVNEFLMLGDISGAPYRIQWSPFNNPTGTWGTDRLTQASFADLDTNLGRVQSIVGGRYALVFQERGVQRLTYVGPPKVFQADIIEEDRGCVAPFSVASVGFLDYFLAQDGFFVTNGSSVQAIGTQRVNRWFFDNVNQSKISWTHSAINWQQESIFWGFVSAESETFDCVLIYSWAQNSWSYAKLPFDWLVGSQETGINLEQLDAIYTDLDSIPLSLDAVEFQPKQRVLSAFVSGVYATFTGEPYEATWETGEAQPAPGSRVFVSGVAPNIEATDWNCKATLLLRDNFGTRSASAEKATGFGGFAPVRGEGLKVAVRLVKPSGTWEAAQGVTVNYTGAGSR